MSVFDGNPPLRHGSTDDVIRLGKAMRGKNIDVDQFRDVSATPSQDSDQDAAGNTAEQTRRDLPG